MTRTQQQPVSAPGDGGETVYDGEELCECGHIRDDHSRGEGWCLARPQQVDACLEFRPARCPAHGGQA